jgi:glycogen(starch) synthase
MPDRPLRVAILARSVHPLHGVGGLERHVYDLVRHLIARDAHVTLITKPPVDAHASASTTVSSSAGPNATAGLSAGASVAAAAAAEAFGVPADRLRLVTVPYVTFPGAGRRGTTVADRITAYPFFGWRAGRVAAKLAYSNAVDLVYALGASGLGYAQARRRHVPTKPLVFNPQGLEEFGATDPDRARLKTIAYGPLQAAVRTCARAADAVIATDHALVPTVLQHLPITPDRLIVIPNGIDVAIVDAWRDRNRQRDRDSGGVGDSHGSDHASGDRSGDGSSDRGNDTGGSDAVDALRARYNIPRDRPLLVSVGRLEANKGFHVLAQALANQRLYERVTWALIGDGPFRPEIERVAAASGLGSRMIMPGRVPDAELHAWYDAADLFVHPTLYEGSSLVTLEAMAHGRPIIATRAGGLPDKVTPGDNGWLVDPDRPDQLAEAISDALQHSPAWTAMGRASRARVERDFAWPVIAGLMIDLFRRLIAAEERS